MERRSYEEIEEVRARVRISGPPEAVGKMIATIATEVIKNLPGAQEGLMKLFNNIAEQVATKNLE